MLTSDPNKTAAWRQRGAQRYWEYRQQKLREQRPKPSRKKRKRDDSEWRDACIEAYGEWCRACGTNREIQMDHMHPRSQGGASDVRNGLPLCRTHHEEKTDGKLLIRPEWLTGEQKAYLAEVRWVVWDSNGQPAGRGWRHFAAEGCED